MKAGGPLGALAVLCVLLAAGCAPEREIVIAPSALPAVPTKTEIATTAAPTPPPPTSSPQPAEPATSTPQPYAQACSPLEGIPISELGLPDLLKTTFQPPRPGMDDGHHGVDFAYWSRGERKTMQGLPILAALEGRVAGVIRNRSPYGNALIIETPLERLAPDWTAGLPAPQPTLAPLGPLNCPVDKTAYHTGGARSMYLLYAHMNETPSLNVGDVVRCGQAIGAVGTTGKSVNPHLHLEARVGPAGAAFESMAHYDTASSEQERAVYCTWRTSGLFAMIDPMSLFAQEALQP